MHLNAELGYLVGSFIVERFWSKCVWYKNLFSYENAYKFVFSYDIWFLLTSQNSAFYTSKDSSLVGSYNNYFRYLPK